MNVSRTAVAGLVIAAAFAGPTSVALADAPAPQVWSLTKQPPPAVTNGDRGFRAVGAVVDGVHVRTLVRYDGADEVERATVSAHGALVASYLEADGTAIAIAHSDRQLFALTWQLGHQPGGWHQIADGVSNTRDARFATASDDSGDLAVFLPASGTDRRIAAYHPGTGWSAPVTIAASTPSGAIRDLSLDNDGEVVGIATARSEDGQHSIVTELRMSLGDDDWSTATTILSDAPVARSVDLDAGPSGSIAFAIFRAKWDGIGGNAIFVSSTPGSAPDVHKQGHIQPGIDLVVSIGTDEARFAYGSDHQYGIVSDHGGAWSQYIPRTYTGAMSVATDSTGDLVAFFNYAVSRHKSFGLLWGAEDAVPTGQVIGKWLDARRACFLDSGVVWGFFDHARGAHGHLYATTTFDSSTGVNQ